MINFTDVEKYVEENKEFIISQLSDFSLTDVILFWSKESELKKLQQTKWQPIIDWCNNEFGCSFQSSYFFEIKNKQENKAKILSILRTLYLKDLVGLYLASTKAKSVLLGLGLIKNKITALEVFENSFLEELYQNKYQLYQNN